MGVNERPVRKTGTITKRLANIGNMSTTPKNLSSTKKKTNPDKDKVPPKSSETPCSINNTVAGGTNNNSAITATPFSAQRTPTTVLELSTPTPTLIFDTKLTELEIKINNHISDYIDWKKTFDPSINVIDNSKHIEYDCLLEKVKLLEEENLKLVNEIKSKDKVIEIISQNITDIKNLQEQEGNSKSKEWTQVPKNKSRRSNNDEDIHFEISQSNSFNPLSDVTETDSSSDNIETISEPISLNASITNKKQNDTQNDSNLTNKGKKNIGKSKPNSLCSQQPNITILGDSMVKRIEIDRVNQLVQNQEVYKKCFTGASTDDMLSYIEPSIKNNKNDMVIIHIGTNDCSKRDKSAVDIANNVFQIVEKCSEKGVKVAISSVICRKREGKIQNKINDLNSYLMEICHDSGSIFIDNSNITKDDICGDMLHPYFSGICKLADNFIQSINFNFNSNNIS